MANERSDNSTKLLHKFIIPPVFDLNRVSIKILCYRYVYQLFFLFIINSSCMFLGMRVLLKYILSYFTILCISTLDDVNNVIYNCKVVTFSLFLLFLKAFIRFFFLFIKILFNTSVPLHRSHVS